MPSGSNMTSTPRSLIRYALRPAKHGVSGMNHFLWVALATRAGLPGVHSTAVAVDPHHWSLPHFTLWERASTSSLTWSAG